MNFKLSVICDTILVWVVGTLLTYLILIIITTALKEKHFYQKSFDILFKNYFWQ